METNGQTDERPDGLFLVGGYMLGMLLDWFAEAADAWDVKKEDVFVIVQIIDDKPVITLDDETHSIRADLTGRKKKMNRLTRTAFAKVVGNADIMASKWNCSREELELKLSNNKKGGVDLIISNPKTGQKLSLVQ